MKDAIVFLMKKKAHIYVCVWQGVISLLCELHGNSINAGK